MKRITIAAAIAATVAGCANVTPAERSAMRDAAVGVAVEIIAEAKDAGIDPVQISEQKLRLINIGCEAADKLTPILDAYIEARHADDPDFEPLDLRGYVAAACTIAQAVVSAESDEGESEVAPAPMA